MRLGPEWTIDISIAATREAIVQRRFEPGANDDHGSPDKGAENDDRSGAQRAVSAQCRAIVRCAQKSFRRRRDAQLVHGVRPEVPGFVPRPIAN
jgi:hypothetical protein